MDGYDAGLRSHCLRVAAWAYELSEELSLSVEEQRLLEQAALLHHLPIEFLEIETVNRLAGDLWPSNSQPMDLKTAAIPAPVLSILVAMRQPCRSMIADRVSALANVIELADLFDEQLEMAQMEGRPVHELLKAAPEDPVIGSALQILRKSAGKDLLSLIPKLPVFPAVAMRAMTVLAKPGVNIGELEQITRLDQVLSGKLMSAANSALMARRFPVKTVRDALTYIGLDTARNVLSAAALRSLFVAPRQKELWLHSVEAAQFSEKLAKMSTRVSPPEAFLAGLVHDVGRLAISMLPANLTCGCERIIAKGCEIAVAEQVFFGFDHAEAGARVLEIWNFPREYVEAVRHHHHPESADSNLASLLYVAEFWSAAEEDLPSNSILREAHGKLGLSAAKIEQSDLPQAGAALAFA